MNACVEEQWGEHRALRSSNADGVGVGCFVPTTVGTIFGLAKLFGFSTDPSDWHLRRLIKSSEPQRWHRPRAQGVHPEAVSELLVLKPKSVGNTGIKSTLHKGYTGPLPDADVLASGAKLSQINPKPLLAHILDGMSKVELVPSQFSPVPHGNPLSYQCLPIAAGVPDVNFPPLPVLGYQFGCNFKFVPHTPSSTSSGVYKGYP
ncbi:uncharacterized protein LOC122146602 [Cyprinus carpio]|uniref:Uncharacterized protein LOC122146602 n=1 Tax=Cyprinus carpio TaxID=7962 RepID=A0A9R0B4S0_CYPCA|nr:uncharacterized protein LOC122146602 [Cyprinus carpio]